MHTESETQLVSDDQNTIKTRDIMESNIWWVGGSLASTQSAFFNFSSHTEHIPKIMSYLARKFLSNCGGPMLRKGTRVLVEAFFKTKADLDTVLTQGLSFTDSTIIKPYEGLSGNAQIKKVRLSKLPFMDQDKLVEAILQSICLYGKVLDCGIYLDAESGLFMRNGFAVLDIQPIEGEQPFSKMAHVIPWCTTNDCFYAIWSSMPQYCSCCHVAGHSISICPDNPQAHRTCWSCGCVGDISHDCEDKIIKATAHGGGTNKK